MVLLTHPLQRSSSVLVAVQVASSRLVALSWQLLCPVIAKCLGSGCGAHSRSSYMSGDQGARVVGLVDGIQAAAVLSDC